jgi:hypothetical protein
MENKMDQPSTSSSVDDYKAKVLTETLVSDLKRLRDLSQKLQFDFLVERTNDILSTQERGGILLQTSVNHVITTATELLKASESPASALEKKQNWLMELSEKLKSKLTKATEITVIGKKQKTMAETFSKLVKTELKQAAARVIESTPVIESEFEKKPKAFQSLLAEKIGEAVQSANQNVTEQIPKEMQQGLITRWEQFRDLADEVFGELTLHISHLDMSQQEVETLHRQATSLVQSVNQAYDVFNSPPKSSLSFSIKGDFRYAPKYLGLIGLFQAIFVFLGILLVIVIGGTLLGYFFSKVLGGMALLLAALLSLLGGSYAAWKFVATKIIGTKRLFPEQLSAEQFEKKYPYQVRGMINKQVKSSSTTQIIENFVFDAFEPLEQLAYQVKKEVGSLLDTIDKIQIDARAQLQTLTQTQTDAQKILNRVQKLSEQMKGAEE